MAIIKKLVHYARKDVDYRVEECKLKQCRMFTNRGFMVTVLDDDGNIVFSPYMISNFSIDGNKIFITVYDLIQHINIEQKLDELCKGFWIFKKQLSVVLMRLDAENKEVYSVRYEKCKLKKYHGKNFTYKGNDPHQWYIELSFGRKEILKNENFNFVTIENKIDDIPTQEELNNKFYVQRHKRYTKKEAEILKNSNRMLDDAAEKVKNSKKLTLSEKSEKLKEIKNAKAENEESAMQFLNVDIKYDKLKNLEKDLVEELNDLENNINK